jgi:hypothetical protein
MPDAQVQEIPDAIDTGPLYRRVAAGRVSIAELKSRHVEGQHRGIAFVAAPNIYEHFNGLRRDFAGMLELCFVHAQLIVCIRRGRELETTVPLFLRLWAEEAKFLTENLNTRWLISACDTFADYGSPNQQAAAMLMVLLINTVKLAETERLTLADSDCVPEKLNAIGEVHRGKAHLELWDGMPCYSPTAGDMPRNMFRRMAKITDADPALALIARTLIQRAAASDTLLGRLSRLNPGFLPPEFQREIASPPLVPAK